MVKLVTGTVIAQLLPFLVLPLLTRTMGAESFGVYSLFFTTMIMLGTLSAFRFDHAINAAKTALHSKLIFFLCIVINIFALIVILLCILLAIGLDYLSNIWLILPFTVFSMSINQSYYLYVNSTGAFGVMSRSRIINSGVCALSQYYFVIVINYQDGVFWGLLIGFVISTFYLYVRIPLSKKGITSARLIFIFKRYVDYPRLVFPGSFVNFVTVYMPIYVVSFLFGAAQAGYYSLAIRVAGVPTSLVGRSIGEVYRVRANEEIKEKGNFKNIFMKVASASLLISVIGFSILFIFSLPLFELVFGEGWDEAAYYVQLLIPMFILQFVTAPIGYSLMLANWQKQEFYWQIFRFVFVSASLLCSFVLIKTSESIVVFASLSLSFSFLVYILLCYKCTDAERI
ncbi:MAG: oligosaccharide flippase family protein [Saprospiraceae bacterium]|nr:oligosaccharide flippase family protein [Saprospiraceae bacterium]